MKLTIKSENPNYVAKVVKLPAPRKHENADKLQIVTIDSQNVVTGLTAKEGDIYIYFPLESRLNHDYLSWSNSYAKAELNKDVAKKGFFPSVGRVKTTKLRGIFSEGYIVPVADLVEWLNSTKAKATIEDFVVDTEFTHFNDTLICEKYVNLDAIRKAQNVENALKNKQGKIKRESKLIENQFRLHIDTVQLKKFVSRIFPNDFISISEKIHGTSAVFGKVLCKRQLKWYEKALKKIGVLINETYYDYVWSSRKVIKNQYADKVSQSFYKEDIWAIVAEKLNPFLKDGMSFYAEIYGQMPSGKWIQSMGGKGFDYGTKANEHNYAIYRITSTNASGEVIEFTEQQIIAYCKKYGINSVPYHYLGYAKNLVALEGSVLTDDRDVELWREKLLAYLIKEYTEMDCPMSANKVPREGIVLRRFNDYPDVYKLKSLRFIAGEADDTEAGQVSVEDTQSVVE